MKKRTIRLGLSLVAAGAAETLAAPRVSLSVDPGEPICWGTNTSNQVSPLPAGNFIQVNAGTSAVCAIKQDNSGMCWGYYQVRIPDGYTFKQVAVGSFHVCGIKLNNSTECWGDNSYGQATVPGPNNEYKYLSAAHNYTCSIRIDNKLACWGKFANGQAIAPPTGTFLDVSVGYNFACGINTDHVLVCWGDNSKGQAAPPTGGFLQVSAGDTHACAIKSDNTVFCWGDNTYGQTTPPVGTTFKQISAGQYHNCGIKTDKSVKCWGTDFSTGSVVQTPTTGQFQQVSANENFACAIKVGSPLLTVTKQGNGTGVVTSNPININCGDVCSATFNAGDTVILTATATQPATFTGWSGACTNSTGTCTVTMDTGKTVTATFTSPNHTLTVKKEGAGIGNISSNPVGINACTGSCTWSFAHGTTVALTPAAGAGSIFTGWSGACTGAAACNVAMTAAKSVTGTFTASGANLAITFTDNNAVVNTSQTVAYTAVVSNAGLGAANGAMLKIPTVANLTVNSVTCGSASGGAVCPTGITVSALQGAGLSIPTLPKGGTVTFTVNTKVGTTANAQLRYTATIATPAGITDPVATNNTAVDSDRVVSNRADFMISGLTLTPAAPVAGATFIAAVVVKNQGSVSSTGGKLGLWYNQSDAVTCGMAPDMMLDIGTVAAGTTKTLTFNNIHAGAATGRKVLRVFADQGCTTAETVETNNQGTYTYWVGGAADLTITAITLNPSAPVVNGTFKADVTVKNLGAIATDGAFLDVWANSTAVPTCNAEGDAWADVPNLAAGGVATVTVTGIPAGGAGAKNLRAYVDSWCEIVESNEANNQMIKAYSVQ